MAQGIITMDNHLLCKSWHDRHRHSAFPALYWIVGAAAAFLISMTTSQAADDRANLVFCCDAENDLYRALAGNGSGFPRHDAARAALDAAEQGASVLILAAGYPQKTTRLSQDEYDLAAKKSLRLYVEYPATLPELACGKPRRTRVERAVIASDFFGSELTRLRIVAINGLHYVPVAFDKSHIVAARVAGFDTAVFGLPRKTDPILFQHPRANLLVSTTKLSHFVTGRYAPKDAWNNIWHTLLTWPCRPAGAAAPRWGNPRRARTSRTRVVRAPDIERGIREQRRLRGLMSARTLETIFFCTIQPNSKIGPICRQCVPNRHPNRFAR
jgi:hypothetical protein